MTDPVDQIDGLTSDIDTDDVSKPEMRAELKSVVRWFADANVVANTSLTSRYAIFIGDYYYRKDTSSAAEADGDLIVQDGDGFNWIKQNGPGTEYFSTSGIYLTFSTSTSDADPGTGKWRANSATFASITKLWIDNAQVGGGSITAWLDRLDDLGSTSARGILRVQNLYDGLQWAEFLVTGSIVDKTGYRELTVSPLSQVDWSFDNNAATLVIFTPLPAMLSLSASYYWNGTTNTTITPSTTTGIASIEKLATGRWKVTTLASNIATAAINANADRSASDAHIDIGVVGTRGANYFILEAKNNVGFVDPTGISLMVGA